MAVYGIDLGTTYCAVAWFDPTLRPTPQLVSFDDAGVAFPSLVLLRQLGERLEAVVGGRATESYHALVGADASAPPTVALVRGAKNFMAVGDHRGEGRWTVGDHVLNPTHVAAVLLRAIRRQVQSLRLPPIDGLVVTHPQRFRNRERLATRQAVYLAELDRQLLGLITEPDAAAWAYEHDLLQRGVVKRARRFLVFDFGGGTLDVTIMQREEGADGRLTIRGVDSFGRRLGGLEVDLIARKHLMERYCRTLWPDGSQSLDLRKVNAWTREEFLQLAEQLKVSLNHDESWGDPNRDTYPATVRVRAARNPQVEHRNVIVKVTLGEYSTWIAGVVDDAMAVIDRALENAGLTDADIDEVRMTGQSSQLIEVRRRMLERFSRVRLDFTPGSYLHPASIVAAGAAVFGARLQRGEASADLPDIVGVVPDEISIQAARVRADGSLEETFRPLIKAQTSTPHEQSFNFKTRADGVGLHDDRCGLSLEVFEGRDVGTRPESIGVYDLRFPRPIPPGAPVAVSLKVDTNAQFTLGVHVDNVRREARLTEAEGVIPSEEIQRHLQLVRSIEIKDE